MYVNLFNKIKFPFFILFLRMLKLESFMFLLLEVEKNWVEVLSTRASPVFCP